MPDLSSSTTSGVGARGYVRAASGTAPWDQYVVPIEDKIITFSGRGAAFMTPGRGAIAQKILALHNATGSPVLVRVNTLKIDLLSTVAKAATVQPPIVRIQRFTAVPTNGTSLAKTGRDSAGVSNVSVTAWGDASADNTSSTTTLTIAAGATLSQEHAPRMLSAVGYEQFDASSFFEGGSDITLRAGEGICVHLDQATVTTGNPSTDKWLATVDWDEYTRP